MSQLITRNNEIWRRVASNRNYQSLLPERVTSLASDLTTADWPPTLRRESSRIQHDSLVTVVTHARTLTRNRKPSHQHAHLTKPGVTGTCSTVRRSLACGSMQRLLVNTVKFPTTLSGEWSTSIRQIAFKTWWVLSLMSLTLPMGLVW